MKVLFFCNLVPRKVGAFEILLQYLAEELKRNNDELVLIFGDRPLPRLSESLLARGVRWGLVDGWTDGTGEHAWRFPMQALAWIRRERPDVSVIHFGDEWPTLLAMLLTWFTRCNTRWVWQQDQQIRDPNYFTAYVSSIGLVGRFCSRLVAMYEGGRQSLLKRGIRADKVTVIPNGVSASLESAGRRDLLSEHHIPPDAILLGTVGSLIERKRISFLLRALTALQGKVHLLVVGDGPLRSDLEKASATGGVADRVHWLGHRESARDVISACDVYVHAAVAEASSYAVTEAMADGLPVVGTKAGAIAEQVEHGVSGFVVERDDMTGFVSHLQRVIDDPALRNRLGAAAKERWRHGWRVEVAARRYQSLYRSVLEQAR